MPGDLRPLYPPSWVLVIGSLAVGFHLFNAVLTTLHVSSGPWVTRLVSGGISPATPPPFTEWIGVNVTDWYNHALKVNHHFHFDSNKQEQLEITLDAVVKDAAGRIVARQRLPDPEANIFVQQRQSLLARQLVDASSPPPQGVVLAPAGQELPTLYWWQPEGERFTRLMRGNANTVPRNQPTLEQPTDTALIAARALGRYLRHAYGAPTVELSRTWRDPVPPSVLFMPTDPEVPRPNVSSYGELPR